ncbi:SDR family oxidoreductase [Oryzihumus sp.]|uniref:SDR family oxidoreductase n=1 Tax=Oryzihumus sp. TaxID=1968903 RepID=UPI002EDA8FF5
MELGLRDRVYVVSGASRGLGFASAEALVAEGARVVLCARDEAAVTSAAGRLGGPDHAIGIAGDLAAPATADALVAAAMARYGRIDGAVISVGGPPHGAVEDVTDEVWRSAFESVFLGPLRLARATLATSTQEGVSITFILSTSVRAPLPGLALSNGLRPGLAMAAKTLADEFGPRGARVNAILPGRIDTDRVRELDEATGRPQSTRREREQHIPLRRYGRPEEVGRVAAFVASPAASYMTGAMVSVDGGSTRSL